MKKEGCVRDVHRSLTQALKQKLSVENYELGESGNKLFCVWLAHFSYIAVLIWVTFTKCLNSVKKWETKQTVRCPATKDKHPKGFLFVFGLKLTKPKRFFTAEPTHAHVHTQLLPEKSVLLWISVKMQCSWKKKDLVIILLVIFNELSADTYWKACHNTGLLYWRRKNEV